MAPPIPKTNPNFHKPFGGTTPGSIGLSNNRSTKGKSGVTKSSTLPPLPRGLSMDSSGKKKHNMRVVTFANGAQKEVREDSSSVLRFPNGDVQIFSGSTGGSVAYYHANSQVIQVATNDGSDIYEFPNRQVERHYPDGRKIVKFPDGTKKRCFPSGMVETFLSCGKYLVIERPDGSKEVKHL
jgi:centromere protein J